MRSVVDVEIDVGVWCVDSDHGSRAMERALRCTLCRLQGSTYDVTGTDAANVLHAPMRQTQQLHGAIEVLESRGDHSHRDGS